MTLRANKSDIWKSDIAIRREEDRVKKGKNKSSSDKQNYEKRQRYIYISLKVTSLEGTKGEKLNTKKR